MKTDVSHGSVKPNPTHQGKHDEAFTRLEKAWMDFHAKHQNILLRIESLNGQKHPFI